MKKSAFTLIETLVSLLIISAVGMASMMLVSSYMKNTYERDIENTAAISNITIIEELKAEVKTLPQLYYFIEDKDIKVTAIGFGEVELYEDGTYSVIFPESYGFSERIKPLKPILFRLDIGDDTPNTKITAVVMIK